MPTPVCELLGIERPIVLAPMVAVPPLAAAVSNAWRARHGDAGEFIEQAVAAEGGIRPAYVHADRGSAMTSGSVAELMTKLASTRPPSRPKTSNDNPYSEAHFLTMKYDPYFPEAFADLAEAAEYVEAYLDGTEALARPSDSEDVPPEPCHGPLGGAWPNPVSHSGARQPLGR
jgi:hypothetical protein